jgi:hypothetical protein
MLLAYGTLMGVSSNQRIKFKPVHFPEIKNYQSRNILWTALFFASSFIKPTSPLNFLKKKNPKLEAIFSVVLIYKVQPGYMVLVSILVLKHLPVSQVWPEAIPTLYQLIWDLSSNIYQHQYQVYTCHIPEKNQPWM